MEWLFEYFQKKTFLHLVLVWVKLEQNLTWVYYFWSVDTSKSCKFCGVWCFYQILCTADPSLFYQNIEFNLYYSGLLAEFLEADISVSRHRKNPVAWHDTGWPEWKKGLFSLIQVNSPSSSAANTADQNRVAGFCPEMIKTAAPRHRGRSPFDLVH